MHPHRSLTGQTLPAGLSSAPSHLATASSAPTDLGTASTPPTHLRTASSAPTYLATTSSPPTHLGTASSLPTYLGTASSPSIHLVTFGSSAIHDVPMSCAADEPGTSGLSAGQEFNPSAIGPFPKAGPRKSTSRIRKKRQSEILTDTPVKQALMEEQQRRGNKNVRKSILGKNKGKQQKKKRKSTKKMLNTEDSDTSDVENLFVVCMERFHS